MSHVAEVLPKSAHRASPKCCRKAHVACRQSAAGRRTSRVAKVLLDGACRMSLKLLLPKRMSRVAETLLLPKRMSRVAETLLYGACRVPPKCCQTAHVACR